MKPHDFEEFSALLSDVMAFQRQSVTQFTLSVWWQACQQFEMEQVRKVFTEHILDPDRGQYPIKPSDLTRLLIGTKTDRALVAWGKVLDGMQRVGAYQSVGFDDPIIHIVVEDLGGWIGVCRCDLKELGHVERRFCDAYRAYATRPLGAYPSRLPGESELENRTAGRRLPAPVLIGNPEKAAEVMRQGGSGPKTQFTLASGVIPSLLLEAQKA